MNFQFSIFNFQSSARRSNHQSSTCLPARQVINHQSGFTLIELLVVVSIIGILATVVTVSSGAARAQARDSQRKADLQNVAAALEIYRAEKHHYPNSPGLQSGGFLGSWSLLKLELYPAYLSQWPEDPKGQSSSANFGQGYVYATNTATAVLGVPGSYYALDVALESDETLSNPELRQYQGSNGDPLFFTSGTYRSQGFGEKVHYRVSGR